MSEPFLIAHKVHGKPAFDIAERMECTECHTMGCPECDDCGYWWLIPSSGHRAYAYWYQPMTEAVPPPPEGWPDHYPTSASPTVAKRSLLAELGLNVPTVKINRRI
jgi:hypothetical protein